MAGNSQRRGRRSTTRKGPSGGTGGKGRQSLAGRGRTLPADERPWHKGYSGDEPLPEKTAWKQDKERRKAETEGRPPKIGNPGTKSTTWGRGQPPAAGKPGAGGKSGAAGKPGAGGKVGAGGRPASGGKPGGKVGGRAAVGGKPASRAAGARPGAKVGPRVAPGRKAAPPKEAPELLVGRNPVVEALRAHVPATALYLAQGLDSDERVKESVRVAGDRGIALLEVSRAELDRMTGGILHQGIGLQVPPYAYESFDDLLAAAAEQASPLLVALDGVTDPRNLGAVVRSAAAFGAHGVFMPERRAAGMTATAWRTSAGAAARVPIAQVTNLTRALKACQEEGFAVVGLDADGDVSLYDLEVAVDPLVVVVGSEGRGLSRLVGQTCDLTAGIPMASTVESLNASVAAAVALAEVARRRNDGEIARRNRTVTDW